MKRFEQLLTAGMFLCITGFLVGCDTSGTTNGTKITSEIPATGPDTTVGTPANTVTSSPSGHISAPNSAQPGSVVKITGWLHFPQHKDGQITIMLYRNHEPNSGLNFETSLHANGRFSSSILIPSHLQDGDYSLLIFVPFNDTMHKVLQKEIHIT